MTTIRAFTAIELSDDNQTKLMQLQSKLKGISPPHVVRWAIPQNIHLTLHFLGDVEIDDLEEIGRAVGAAAVTYQPFSLNLAGLGCFPNTSRPRVVWVGVAGQTDLLIKLHAELGQQLQQRVDFEPEVRPYAPHLTIGRVKNGIPQRRLTQLGQMLKQEIPQVKKLATLPVEKIHLIQSDLKSDGPVYTSLAYGALKG